MRFSLLAKDILNGRIQFGHTNGLLIGFALVLLVAPGGIAQRRPLKPRGPRALAVVEFPAQGKPRLVPVAILIEGRFYDAAIYKATPEPMALEPGTVYEAERSGEPAGFFTVNSPARMLGDWFGRGEWNPHGVKEPEAKASVKPSPQRDPDAPPVLRRPAPQSSGGSSSAPTPVGDPDAPPGLKRPTSKVPPEADEKAPANAGARTTQAAAAEEATGRPRLRRNPGPLPEVRESEEELKAQARPMGKIKEALPAISDADPTQPRDYKFDWRPEEKQRLEQAATALARSALAKYAGARTKRKPGELEQVEVRAFNLDFSNIPYVVVTAQAAAPTATQGSALQTPDSGFRFHVAVIAREGVTREMNPILVSVTDSTRLDAFPRLELVDAVDADADGRAELLFREVSDFGRAYKIYRLVGDQATALFTSEPLK